MFLPSNQIKHKASPKPPYPAESCYVLQQPRLSFKRQTSSELWVLRSSKKQKWLGRARDLLLGHQQQHSLWSSSKRMGMLCDPLSSSTSWHLSLTAQAFEPLYMDSCWPLTWGHHSDSRDFLLTDPLYKLFKNIGYSSSGNLSIPPQTSAPERT